MIRKMAYCCSWVYVQNTVTYSCNEYTTTAYTTDIKNRKELKHLTSDQLGVIVEGSMKYTMLQKV